MQALLSSHEVVIFTKFHEDWAKIVDFLLIANYLAFPIFYYPYFAFCNFKSKALKKNKYFYKNG